ncbi:MAG: hypothetical protein C4534_11230 [Gaiellales bacterium]|nr:MAG: hypothetical protein C4534_11230 [Gaiellales bacterium]
MSKKKTSTATYIKTAILGAVTITSYYLLLSNQALVTEYFIKGGYYAALPIGTALYFSFVHGAFASNVLGILGITPKGSSH